MPSPAVSRNAGARTPGARDVRGIRSIKGLAALLNHGDQVLEKGKDYKVGTLRTDVKKLGLNMQQFDSCMSSGEGMEAVKRDIEEGKRMEVRSTPTYVINGVRMSGVITPASFEELIAVIQEGR